MGEFCPTQDQQCMKKKKVWILFTWWTLRWAPAGIVGWICHEKALILISEHFNHAWLSVSLPNFKQYIDCCTGDNKTLDSGDQTWAQELNLFYTFDPVSISPCPLELGATLHLPRPATPPQMFGLQHQAPHSAPCSKGHQEFICWFSSVLNNHQAFGAH